VNQPIQVSPASERGRLKVLLLVAAAVLLVGLVGPRLLFRSGSESAAGDSFFPEPSSTSAAAPTSPTTTAPAVVALSDPALVAAPGRNPFNPTVAIAGASPAVAPPVATTVPRPPAIAVRPTARLRLLEVSLDATGHPLARVRVNDVAQTVAVGQVFAGRYTVESLDITGRCGRFVTGGVRFSLCEGDERLA